MKIDVDGALDALDWLFQMRQQFVAEWKVQQLFNSRQLKHQNILYTVESIRRAQNYIYITNK